MTTTLRPTDQPLALNVHICDQRRSYRAVFTGPDADARAAAFIDDRTARMNYAIMFEAEITGADIDLSAYPLTTARLLPTCHHGMDGRLCMDPDGPHHYGTREWEMAHGG